MRGSRRLLEVKAHLGCTRLAWLTQSAAQATPKAIKAELVKRQFLHGLDADTLDMAMLPVERRRWLAGIGRHWTNQMLQRCRPLRRYPAPRSGAARGGQGLTAGTCSRSRSASLRRRSFPVGLRGIWSVTTTSHTRL